MNNRKIFQFVFLFILCFHTLILTAQTWHSSLYPENWIPGYSDSEGRFLHDFSYAGYKSGLEKIPVVTSNIVDVTKPPYNADNKGNIDATIAIQRAIDNVGKNGGGVIFLPAGEYNISISGSNIQALKIKYNNVIIRGEGATKTFIKSNSTNIRNKQLIYFYPERGSWNTPLNGKKTLLSKDLLLPTTTIPVADASMFKKGDLVAIVTDLTDAFIAEHGCTGYWTTFKGVRFCREIVSVDSLKNCIEIDAPTRYFLKMRDNARVFKINSQLTECGLEDLSIGNIENKGNGWDESDYTIEGTGAYEVHGSHLVVFRNALNCWVRNVSTYRPKENTMDIHVLANCLRIAESRFVSIENCNFQRTQYEGGGGNGYLYTLEGNDCLVKNCHGEHGRHNYDFKEMSSSGNVLLKCTSKDPRLFSDFHMALSMANLFDSFDADGDGIDASFRPWGAKSDMHMYSTTQSVIWNTKGKGANKNANLVISRQYGQGYVIGTSGVVSKVLTTPVLGIEGGISFNTGPEDFVEGEGKGETLLPESLYLDQFKKRIQRMPLNENFENFDLNTLTNFLGKSWIPDNNSAEIQVQVVPNPQKGGINTSDKVLEINRLMNTSITINDVLNKSHRGVSTISYNLNMDDSNFTIELKVLKKTAGRLAIRLYSDENTMTYSELITPDLPASNEWKLVRFNCKGKLLRQKSIISKLVFLPEINIKPIENQTNSLIIYIDEVKIISNKILKTQKK